MPSERCLKRKALAMPETVSVLGVPLSPLSRSQILDRVSQFVNQTDPQFFITANLHYAMLMKTDPELNQVNQQAAFLVADGMPLVWASRGALPERVAGADLLYDLCERAATEGWKVFFLGGRPETSKVAIENLVKRYPGLQVSGCYSPPFGSWNEEQNSEIARRIHEARPDLLIGAFSMPQGEKWLCQNVRRLDVPLSVQLGAALDFAAGAVSRAPHWMQVSGMEWAYRLAMEPRRLTRRYVRNFSFWYAPCFLQVQDSPFM